MTEIKDYQFSAVDVARWWRHLEEHGYVVILDVVAPYQLYEGVRLFLADYPGKHSGLLVDGFGHTDFLWFCRTLPGVIDIYRILYDQQQTDLISAFDRLTAITADAGGGDEDYWLHVDYPLFSSGAALPGPVYQSFISFTPPRGPGFRVVPASASAIPAEELRAPGRLYAEADREATYYQLAPSYVDVLDAAGAPRKIESPAGSLTVWRSGVIHDNTTTVTAPAGGLLDRLVAYQCYVPRSWASARDLRQRTLAFRNGQTTTHWPALHLSVCGEKHKWDYAAMMRKYPLIKDLI